MKYTYLFIGCSILLCLSVALGMHSTIDKRTSSWLIITRIILLAMLVGKIIFFLAALPSISWWLLIQIISLVVLFIMVEMIFRRKLLTFGVPWLALILEITALLVAIICIF
ncbi:hypothetical protein [uncultured Limosilactobacillus sp.]|uniref:hypothetical protein n=1 Tax=uncultured Limosilactobacillus sp. TaxID=2837629 RepID=UPI0025E13FDD|nr:hypothetical protein [uncultured Limosilactobacillus sp.]